MAGNKRNTTKEEPSEDRDLARKELRRNQIFGIVLGVIGGLMTANFWPGIQQSIGWNGAIVWGAAIGGMIGSLAQFERAGKVLTRKDNRGLNLAVGLSVPILLIVIVAAVLNLLTGSNTGG